METGEPLQPERVFAAATHPRTKDREAADPADTVQFGRLQRSGEGGLGGWEVAVTETDPAQVAGQNRLGLADLGQDGLGLFEMVARGFQVARYQCPVAVVVMCERLVYPVPGTAGHLQEFGVDGSRQRRRRVAVQVLTVVEQTLAE